MYYITSCKDLILIFFVPIINLSYKRIISWLKIKYMSCLISKYKISKINRSNKMIVKKGQKLESHDANINGML